jgi:phosphohistidine phosphatase
MRTLLLLRHAKSSSDDPELEDHERPLNKRGKRDAPRIGRLLAAEQLIPELALCSSARRTRDTAFAALRACGYDREIRVLRSLYMAGPEACLQVLSALGQSPGRVLLVAHSPGLEALIELVTGESVELPTAALARIDLEIDGWRKAAGAAGTLRNVWRPKELGAESPEPGRE